MGCEGSARFGEDTSGELVPESRLTGDSPLSVFGFIASAEVHSSVNASFHVGWSLYQSADRSLTARHCPLIGVAETWMAARVPSAAGCTGALNVQRRQNGLRDEP